MASRRSCWSISWFRNNRAKALVTSTGEPHQAVIDLVFDAVLTKPLAPCATQRGTKALASQKASTFFTLFLNRRSQFFDGNPGRWQGEKRLQIQAFFWQLQLPLRGQFQQLLVKISRLQKGNEPGNCQIAIPNQDLLAGADSAQVGTQSTSQLSGIDGSHNMYIMYMIKISSPARTLPR